jgi:hypothetical protein
MILSSGAPVAISLAVAVLSLGCSVYLYIQFRGLQKLRATFFAGKNGADLEAVLYAISRELESQEGRLTATEHAIQQLSHQLGFTIQKIGVIRFNPFGDGGGNFSFSAALLDSHNTGLVLTSLYGREQNRVYAKRIHNGNSESPLNEEEAKALEIANQPDRQASPK